MISYLFCIIKIENSFVNKITEKIFFEKEEKKRRDNENIHHHGVRCLKATLKDLVGSYYVVFSY